MAWALLTHTAQLGNSTTVTTSAIDTSGAALIVVAFGGGYNLNVPINTAVTDSASNTNWFMGRTQQSGITIYGQSMFFIPNPTTSASHTFTATGPVNTFPSLAVACFSGGFGRAEKVMGTYSAGVTSIQPGSITPTADNALLVTQYTSNGGTGTNSINGGFTITDSAVPGSFGGPIALAYLIQTSAAAANPTWSTTGSNVNALAGMISFLLQGSTGGARGYVFGG